LIYRAFLFQINTLPSAAAGPRGAIPFGMESLQIPAAYQAQGTSAESALAGRVLIADDQPHVLDALQLLLKSHGYRTEAVTHPARVLQALRSGEFDVVLMDLNYTRDTTAGGEGLELVSQIRLIDENLPLVVMTAWSSVDLAVDAMRRGASDFVQKPWGNRQLLEKLETQVERCRSLRRVQRQRADELQDAREIQNNLLPRNIPQVKDFEIVGMTQPVRHVGGDYYNVVRISETETVLCIADVSGKGMPAALLMSSLQAALKPLMWDTRSPRELCRRLNRILCEIAPVGKFVSFFYAVLDTKDNRLTYCNAGHNPPVLVRANGAASELNAAGAVLGQFPDWVYEQSDLQLRPGDTLMLFTDGLVEASDEDHDEFGEERVIRIALENRDASAGKLERLLTQAASEHCGGRFQDDATMIVLRAV
jgi:sigma-B regulation protein RsbU (phosphoserine phosphatase)